MWRVRPTNRAEMMAVFHRKLREGAIRPVAYAALLGQVRAHNEAGAFHWLAPDEEMFKRIAQVLRLRSWRTHESRPPSAGSQNWPKPRAGAPIS